MTKDYRLRTKIIFTVHGWYFNEDIGELKKIITRFFSWLTVLFSTKTIVISKNDLKQGKCFPFLKSRFTLIYNGVNKIDFKDRVAVRSFIQDITKANKSKTWIASIAELHKNKGLGYLIKSIKGLEDQVVLFIIGEGEERRALENLIKKLGLEESVFLMGYLDEAPRFLKAFDIFALTSVKEGHPYTLLEAGLANLPVIGSNIPGIRDILKPGGGILVQPKVSREIRKAIKTLLENPSKKAQFSSNLKNRVKKEFSFSRTLREVVNIYETN